MKKIFILLSIMIICFGNAAQSQDTIRLFGHRDSQKTKPVPDTVPAAPQVYTSNPNEIQTLTGPGRNVGFYF